MPGEGRRGLKQDGPREVPIPGAALAKTLGDETKLAQVHRRKAELLLSQGQYQEARREEELAITRRLGDKMGQALALKGLGAACGYLGDYDRALAHFEPVVELMRKLQDHRG